MNHQRNMRVHRLRETRQECADRLCDYLKRGGISRIRHHHVKNSKQTTRWILISIHQNRHIGGRWEPLVRQSFMESYERIVEDLEYMEIKFNVAYNKLGKPQQIIIDIDSNREFLD